MNNELKNIILIASVGRLAKHYSRNMVNGVTKEFWKMVSESINEQAINIKSELDSTSISVSLCLSVCLSLSSWICNCTMC